MVSTHSYRIYTHPTKRTEAIKEGFSWPAAAFGFFWALYRRAWLATAIAFTGNVVVSLFKPGLPYNQDPVAFALFGLLFWWLFGLLGNLLVERSRLHQGYTFRGTRTAHSVREAVLLEEVHDPVC